MQSELDERPQASGEVTVKLLGGFVATRDGEPVAGSRWRLRKGRELVKLLALAPKHRLHREQLMEALWPDLDPAAAANNLHQVVHVARRALGVDTVSLDDELLTLRARVDVDDFERAAKEARRAGSHGAYGAALSLYAGELLPENRYDDWASGRREELEQLHDDLLRESSTLDAAAPVSSLPAQASSFIGREHELRELTSVLSRTRLLTLAGAGGAGKTRLALELARGAEPSFADGAVLVELAPVAEERLVVSAVAAALDIGALPARSLLDGITDFLAPRSTLLVLDNCEHVLHASAALADALLRATPGVTILATSREPLRVAGEVVFRVPSMAIPDPEQRLAPEQLLRYESVALLTERAQAAQPDFVVDDGTADDVARICFRLDGLPLALELAAARLGALGTATLAERLDDRFRLLRTGSRVGPTRQQTLAATLQWSHELLEDEEKLLLRRLSAFAGGFDLPAAEVVCGGDGLEGTEIADLLARLVEKSLVSAEPSRGEVRYRLLETVRLYAGEQLQASGETEALVGRHADWAWATAEQEGDSPRLDREAANLRIAHDALLAREPRDALGYCVALTPFWLRRIDLDEAHRRFTVALGAVVECTAQRAAALVAASAIDFRAGTIACGADHAQESYEIARELDDVEGQWHALQRLGEFAISHDDGNKARSLFEPAREVARREGLDAYEAVSRYSLGVAQWLLGDLAGAEERLIESAASFRALVDSPAPIPSLLNIAEMHAADPAAPGSLRIVFEETLHPLLDSSCSTAVGYVLSNQATIARLRGEPERAGALLEEAGERFAESEDVRGQADVLMREAYLSLSQGSTEAAREHLARALELRRGLHDRRAVGMTLAARGLLETTGGDYEQAEQPLAEARELFRRAGDRWGLASSLWRTADLAIARGRLDDAEASLEEARAVVGATERQRWIAATLAASAEVASLRGDSVRAASLSRQAGEHYHAGGDEASAAAMRAATQSRAKDRQRPRKATTGSTARTAKTKRRQ